MKRTATIVIASLLFVVANQFVAPESAAADAPNASCTNSPCTLSTPGTYTFTVAAGMSALNVQVWGAGGGAGGGCINVSGGSNSSGGAGGGGGSYASSSVSASTGQSFTVVVGGAGYGGSTAMRGGASSFGTALTANGGAGGGLGSPGPGCPNSAPGGAGGTASGQIATPGSSGASGTLNGSGGSGGAAGGPGGGAGGTGGAAITGDGGFGLAPGGGGGGDGGDGSPGRGADGRVVISWSSTSSSAAVLSAVASTPATLLLSRDSVTKINVPTSLVSFKMGASSDQGVTTKTTFTTGETVVIAGSVTPQVADVGMAADIFIVVRTTVGGVDTWTYRSANGAFVPWPSVTISDLQPATSVSSLKVSEAFEVHSGTLVAAQHRIYIGYRVSGSTVLHYTGQAMILNVGN